MKAKNKLNSMIIKIQGIANYYKNKPKKLLFDHIPKCAGTTINEIIDLNYPFWKIFSMDGSNPQNSVNEFKKIKNKKRYSVVRGHLAGKVIDYLPERYIIVTTLRDPIKRIISHYYYVKRTKNHYLYNLVKKNNLTLKDYVALDTKITKELRNYYVSYFSGLSYKEVINNKDLAIQKALSRITQYDLVGFQERLDDFILNFSKITGIVINYIPKKNVTKQKKKINNEVIDIIKQFNEIDIIFYNECKKLSKKAPNFL